MTAIFLATLNLAACILFVASTITIRTEIIS